MYIYLNGRKKVLKVQYWLQWEQDINKSQLLQLHQLLHRCRLPLCLFWFVNGGGERGIIFITWVKFSIKPNTVKKFTSIFLVFLQILLAKFVLNDNFIQRGKTYCSSTCKGEENLGQLSLHKICFLTLIWCAGNYSNLSLLLVVFLLQS